ncbi:MAG TPA: Cof-type HAD-IIB family hydrolase [Tissierellia bacterium]|nr:Cof-type HAD-IIB family hydrolase [Tissierellia bacterium]
MRYKLIAIDLDFTLLNNQHRITKRNQRALMELSEIATVVFASGRPISSMAPYLKLFPKGTIKYLLGSNGAHCIDEEGNIFYEAYIEGAMLLPIYREAQRRDVSFHFFHEGAIYSNVDSIIVRKDAEFMEMPLKIVDDFDSMLVGMHLHKFHSMGEPPKLLEYYEWLVEQNLPLHPILSKPYIMEVPPSGVDKGIALDRLAKQLGIRRREVLAAGDSFNDAGMLKYAGLGLAMNNAPKGVKTIADRTLYVNHEENLAEILLEIVRDPKQKRLLTYKESLI